MSATAELRRTPLHAAHQALGARLVDFHGWELPMQYASILKEHQAVRSACGLFDVSHMRRFLVEGPGAMAFLQKVNSNDLSKAGPGKAVYSHLLNEKGGVVDDVIAGCSAPGRYLVVANAGTAAKDWEWLNRHARGFEARLEDWSERTAMVAVQGPQAARLLAELAPGCASLPRFGVLEHRLFGQPCWLQRTGYTGEDGFEVVLPNEVAARLWEELLARGRSLGTEPCGLGARDTLRLEAGYLLYGQDVDEQHTPLEAGYAWVVKFDKGDFIGREALLRQRQEGVQRRLIGLRLLERGVPRAGAPVFSGDAKLGTLASATFSPTLQAGIGAGYLPASVAPGAKLQVELHGRRVEAEAAAIPFYKRKETRLHA